MVRNRCQRWLYNARRRGTQSVKKRRPNPHCSELDSFAHCSESIFFFLKAAQVLLTIQMLKDEVQALFDDAGKRIDLATPFIPYRLYKVYSNALDENEPLALDIGSMGKGQFTKKDMFVVVSEGVSDCLQPPPATRAIDVLNFTPLNNKPSKKKKEMLDKFCETPFYLKLLKEHKWNRNFFLYFGRDGEVVGDGLLMSNAKLIERAVLEYACNVLLLKRNEKIAA
ncbi:hypothetical protein Ahy_B01g055064 isoform A [Arachis hypogaea]|uniref:Uncharacterized protein n=1 Tax=Arachis hypogaea TaxID=3818 RepID=A0A445AUZ5_ARAHY|nr:hypothetical protein Ahy_B01g055064 isoform A [Arachis hypogaea]